MTLTEEWTQAYPMQLPQDRSILELVDYIIGQNRADLPHATKVANVSQEFDLHQTVAERALERVAGGILIAAFGDNATTPDSERDPIAYTSYRLTVQRRQQHVPN